jgi:VWFA-related protein
MLALVLLMSTPSALVSASNPQDKPQSDQEEKPIHLKTDLVELRAVVTDKSGRVVKSLTKSDFEIVESGQPQVISFFSAEDLTSTGGAPEAVRRPGAETKTASEVREHGRTIVLFVDTLHLSEASLLRLRKTLLDFVNEQLTDRDVAGVVTTSGGLGIFGQFTQDKEVLRSAIARLSASPESRRDSLYTPYLAARVEQEAPYALDTAMNIVMGEERLPEDPQFRDIVASIARARAREIISEATYRRRVTLMTLKAVADRLAEMPGQRLIMLLTDGFTMLDNAGVIDSSDLQAASSRASRSGVVVYSFGAKGLATLSIFDATRRGTFNPDPGLANRIVSFASAGDRELEAGPARIAKETGGESFFTTNDLGGALQKSLEENGVYYSLSYYSSGHDDKKAFHSVRVRIKGHPEFRVRTQHGYLTEELRRPAPVKSADPAVRLLEAMNAPLATSELEVDAAADFLDLQSDGAQVTLYVYANGRRVGYVSENGNFVGNLGLLIEVIDSQGRPDGITEDKIEIRLSAKQLEEAGLNIYRYNKRLKLKPGLYQIRIGVRDEHTKMIGTASAWVDVADVNSRKPVLSDITLARAQTANHEAPAQPAGAVVPAPASHGVSVFTTTDSIDYRARVYFGNPPAQEAKLKVHWQIRKGADVILEDERPLSSLVVERESNSVEAGARIGLSNIPPAIYELRVTLVGENSDHPATRAKAFEVRPGR